MTSHVLASVLKSKFRQYSKLLFERKEPLPICKRVSLKKEAGARLKRSQIILSVIYLDPGRKGSSSIYYPLQLI